MRKRGTLFMKVIQVGSLTAGWGMADPSSAFVGN